MILEILLILISFAVSLVLFQICVILYRQAQTNKFFKLKSPNLPLIDNPSILGGHAATFVHRKDNCLMVHKCHQKFGRTLGAYHASRPSIGTTDLDLIKFMVIDEPDAHVNRMKPNIPFEELETHTLMFAEDEQWRRLRQASAPSFTNYKVKSPNVLNEINEVIDKFVKYLNDKISEAVTRKGENFIIANTDDIFHRYALALVFKCFYKQDNVINFYAKQDRWVQIFHDGFKKLINPLLVLCVIFPAIKRFANFFMSKFTSQGLMIKEIMGFIEQQTKLNFKARREFNEARRLAERENRTFDGDNYSLTDGRRFSRNLIDYFIDQYYERKITRKEYLHNSFFLIFAANTTSANALIMLIHHLAHNQDIQDKLRGAIEMEGIESEYLLWCINESLRLYPPAPIGCSRTLTKDYTTKDGHLIPAGVYVYTSTYSIHRDPEYWGKDAEDYRPERWANSRDFDPVQFLAFGAGKRACIGRYFAMQEMKMLMGVLMRQFKFDVCEQTTGDNTFQCPLLSFIIFEKPHYIKISRL